MKMSNDTDCEVPEIVQMGAGDGEQLPVAASGDGSNFDLELEQLKLKPGGWKACVFIFGGEFFERLTYYTLQINLIVYLQKGFSMSAAAASNNTSNWAGTCFLTPLIGAYIADSYLGRFRTISVFSVIYLLGIGTMALSSFVPALKPPFCQARDVGCHYSEAQIGVFFLALYFIALGSGGIKGCIVAFGAGQFDENDEKEMKWKSSFFNWFSFIVNVAALLSSSVLVWMQENVGWAWGIGVSALFFVVAGCVFYSGSCLYRHQRHAGSAFTKIAQVVVASVRKWRIAVPSDITLLYESSGESRITGRIRLKHTHKLRFFDKAAVKTEKSARKLGNPWHLTPVTQVEELKILICILPLWISGIIINTVCNQTTTLFILQGQTMNNHIGHFNAPAASIYVVNTLSVLICIAFYDQFVVPVVSKYTGHPRGFTHLQRIGIGMFISILAITAAALVEMIRLRLVQSRNLYNASVLPMSIFWQVPQYFMIGATEVLTNIGSLEFFHDEVPDGMRSIGTALSYASIALGNFACSALVSLVDQTTRTSRSNGWIPDNINYGHIDYFFWLLAILSTANLIVYLILCHFYEYKLKINKEIEISSR